MIKTDIDITDAIYAWIAASDTAGAVSGAVYKDQRPLNSKKEDIVIAVLTRDGGKQIQTAYVNVNIYVPDIKRGGDMIENTARLRTLCSLAAADFDYVNNGDSIYELDQQEVYKVNDTDLHAINNRIKVRFNNEHD